MNDVKGKIDLGLRGIGPGFPVFVTADVAQAHDGSLGAAHAYIDAVADAGADAVKFQTHIAAEESTPGEPWRVKFSSQDATRYDYWKRMEFPAEQWRELAEHAIARGLIFLSSPFSVAAVRLLQGIGIPAWKLGAGEIFSPDIIEAITETGKPVLLSNGMCVWKELDAVVEKLKSRNVPFAVYQCTTSYPCPPEKIGLNMIEELRSRYGCPVGLSDHTGTIYSGIAACALGINLLEVHVTFSRKCFGPDVPASITIDELQNLVDGIRFIEKAISHPVDKNELSDAMMKLRDTFRKRVVAKTDLEAGKVLETNDFAFKKAADGMHADAADYLPGRVLKGRKAANEPIRESDIE